MNLSSEKILLLNLLKKAINKNENYSELDDINYAELFNLADKHSVNMICLDSLKGNIDNMPESVYNNWVYFASRKMAINENVVLTQKKLTSLLEDNNIKYFVFKGLAISSYYENHQLRELGDIDFYVDYSDFKKVHFLLKENGFKLVSTKSEKHFNYEYNGVEIEMHKEFWDMPENECGKYLETTIKKSLDDTSRVTVDGYSFSAPNYLTNALILVLHIINHIQKGGIGLRQILDFASFYSSDDFKNNIDKILNTFKKGGIYKTAQIIAKLSNEYFSAPYYDFLDDVDEELCRLFLIDIIESGNFGKLSEEKYYASSLLTSTNEGFFKRLVLFCKSSWRPCSKHNILLPIAPFYIAIRYICRAVLGKRPKINPLKLTKNSISRLDLYKNLNFFEEN